MNSSLLAHRKRIEDLERESIDKEQRIEKLENSLDKLMQNYDMHKLRSEICPHTGK